MEPFNKRFSQEMLIQRLFGIHQEIAHFGRAIKIKRIGSDSSHFRAHFGIEGLSVRSRPHAVGP